MSISHPEISSKREAYYANAYSRAYGLPPTARATPSKITSLPPPPAPLGTEADKYVDNCYTEKGFPCHPRLDGCSLPRAASCARNAATFTDIDLNPDRNTIEAAAREAVRTRFAAQKEAASRELLAPPPKRLLGVPVEDSEKKKLLEKLHDDAFYAWGSTRLTPLQRAKHRYRVDSYLKLLLEQFPDQYPPFRQANTPARFLSKDYAHSRTAGSRGMVPRPKSRWRERQNSAIFSLACRRELPLDHLAEALWISEHVSAGLNRIKKEQADSDCQSTITILAQNNSEIITAEEKDRLFRINEVLEDTESQINHLGSLVCCGSDSDSGLQVRNVCNYTSLLVEQDDIQERVLKQRWKARAALAREVLHIKDSKEANSFSPLLKRLFGSALVPCFLNAIDALPLTAVEHLLVSKGLEDSSELEAQQKGYTSILLNNEKNEGVFSNKDMSIPECLVLRTTGLDARMDLTNVTLRVLDFSKGYVGSGSAAACALARLVTQCINCHTLNLEGLHLHENGIKRLCGYFSAEFIGRHPSLVRINFRGNLIDVGCLRCLCYALRGGLPRDVGSKDCIESSSVSLGSLALDDGYSENRCRIVECVLDLTPAERIAGVQSDVFPTFIDKDMELLPPLAPTQVQHDKIPPPEVGDALFNSVKMRLALCLCFSLLKAVIHNVSESIMKTKFSPWIWECLRPLYYTTRPGPELNAEEMREICCFLDKNSAKYHASSVWNSVLSDTNPLNKDALDGKDVLPSSERFCSHVFTKCFLSLFGKGERELRFEYLRYLLGFKGGKAAHMLPESHLSPIGEDAERYILL